MRGSECSKAQIASQSRSKTPPSRGGPGASVAIQAIERTRFQPQAEESSPSTSKLGESAPASSPQRASSSGDQLRRKRHSLTHPSPNRSAPPSSDPGSPPRRAESPPG